MAAAALGHLIWGEFVFGLTGSLLIGSIPGVIIGAHISTRAPEAFIKPVLALVLSLTALKLLGVPNEVLLGILVASIAAGTVAFFVRRRRLPAEPLAESLADYP